MVKRTKEVRKPSNMPIVLFGVAWAVCCIVLPMIRLSDYLIAAGLSLIVFAVSRKLIPDEVQTVEIKLSPLEQMRADQLDKAQQVLAELVKVTDRIDDSNLASDLKRITTVCTEIVRKMEKDDNTNDQSRKLVDHYLPMLVNLLKNYDELEENPIQTDNVRLSRANISKDRKSVV